MIFGDHLVPFHNAGDFVDVYFLSGLKIYFASGLRTQSYLQSDLVFIYLKYFDAYRMRDSAGRTLLDTSIKRKHLVYSHCVTSQGQFWRGKYCAARLTPQSVTLQRRNVPPLYPLPASRLAKDS